jgi:hypothetical protein
VKKEERSYKARKGGCGYRFHVAIRLLHRRVISNILRHRLHHHDVLYLHLLHHLGISFHRLLHHLGISFHHHHLHRVISYLHHHHTKDP